MNRPINALRRCATSDHAPRNHHAELRCPGLNHGLVAHDHPFAAIRQRLQNIPMVLARPNLRTVAEHDGSYYRFTICSLEQKRSQKSPDRRRQLPIHRFRDRACDCINKLQSRFGARVRESDDALSQHAVKTERKTVFRRPALWKMRHQIVRNRVKEPVEPRIVEALDSARRLQERHRLQMGQTIRSHSFS